MGGGRGGLSLSQKNIRGGSIVKKQERRGSLRGGKKPVRVQGPARNGRVIRSIRAMEGGLLEEPRMFSKKKSVHESGRGPLNSIIESEPPTGRIKGRKKSQSCIIKREGLRHWEDLPRTLPIPWGG